MWFLYCSLGCVVCGAFLGGFGDDVWMFFWGGRGIEKGGEGKGREGKGRGDRLILFCLVLFCFVLCLSGKFRVGCWNIVR